MGDPKHLVPLQYLISIIINLWYHEWGSFVNERWTIFFLNQNPTIPSAHVTK